MNMNGNTVTDMNDEILNMPSMPATFVNKVVHYYVDVRGVEEYIVDNELPKDDVDGALPPVDPANEPSTSPLLG